MKTKNSALLFILGLGFFLRVLPLDQSYWLDESINVRAVSSKGFIDLITQYSLGDFHPPLYHVFLRFWISFIGNNEVATRILSVFFGVITIYFLYRISSLIFRRTEISFFGLKIPIQIIPSILLATSGLHIYYSGESRMYSLAAMFTTIAMFYLLKIKAEARFTTSFENLKNVAINTIKELFKPDYWLATLRKSDSWFYIFALYGALMTDYVPWLLLPLLILLVPLETVVALILTSAWWPFFYKQLQIGLGTAAEFPLWGQVVGGFSLKNTILIVIKFLIGRVSIDNNLLYFSVLLPPVIITLLLSLRALKNLSRKTKLIHYIPLMWLIVPISVGIVLSTKVSLLSYFRFLFVLPAFYLVITQGLRRMSKTTTYLVVIVLLATQVISSGAYIFMPKFHREDWRGLAAWIDETNSSSAISLIPNYAQADPYLYYQKKVPITDTFESIDQLPDTFYLIRYLQEIFDPEDHLRERLEDLDYTLVEQKSFNGVVVWHYQRTDRLFAFQTE